MPEIEEQDEASLNETVERVLGMLTRRRWWILGTACGVALATIAVLMVLPNRYTSSATLLVVQQQVPERYVVPNSTTDLTSALQAMKEEVLSRNTLLKIINDFGLYPKQRKRLAPEELLALMLRNIDIVPLNQNPQPQQKDYDAFRISFTTENAVLAQQVTTTLTSLFINENLRSRAEQSTNTTSFLHEQVAAKGKKLEEQEQRLRDFKLRHVGELPEQQQGNLAILTGLQAQLQSTMASLNRAEQQHVYLQSLIDATTRRPATAGLTSAPEPAAIGSPTLSPLDTAERELARLESSKASMTGKGYTVEHPDMVKISREIVQAQNEVKRLMAAPAPSERTPLVNSRPRVLSAAETAENTTFAQLKSNLEANRLEIENLTKDQIRLRTTIAQYEGRLNQTPVREQEQAAILRDTEAMRQEYGDLLKKEQESQLATNLEKQQGGQQFRLIDPATIPTVPSSPKRLKMSFTGLAAGLALGLALGFLLEMRDTSFHSDKEFSRCMAAAPFVLDIPLLPTLAELRQRKLRNTIEWAAGLALVALVAVAEAFVFRRG